MSKARDLADLAKNANDRLDAVASSDGALSNRNLIINGAMTVAQRGTSSTAMGYQTVDRWGVSIGDGTATKSQSTDAPSGFANSLSVAMTTAAGGITTYNYLHQYIEGNLIDRLSFGTSNAKTITLSFYVKSSITGTWGGSIRNFVAAPATSYRSQSFLYTIDAANTWEHKTVTISGDTGGSGQWNTGSLGAMSLFFDMGSVGLTQATGSWLGNNCVGATGTQASFITTTNATWQITGVQLEVGDTATPFEHRSYSDQLSACQRYFQRITGAHKSGGAVGDRGVFMGHCWSTNSMYWVHHFTTPMRSGPSVSQSNSGSSLGTWYSGGSIAAPLSALNIQSGNEMRAEMYCTLSSTLPAGNGSWFRLGGDSYWVDFDAEL